MTEQDRFLRALAENEDDTTTRLVYADWLEEHDEYEEADRQRKWPAAKQWLLGLCKEEVSYYGSAPFTIPYEELIAFGHRVVTENNSCTVASDGNATRRRLSTVGDVIAFVRDRRPRFHGLVNARGPGVPQFGHEIQRAGRACLLQHGNLLVVFRCLPFPAFFPPHHSFTEAEEWCDGKNAALLRRRHQRSGAEDSGLVIGLTLAPQMVDGAANLGSQDGERLRFAALFLLACQPSSAALDVADEQTSSLAEGPLEMALPIFLPAELFFLPADSWLPRTSRA